MDLIKEENQRLKQKIKFLSQNGKVTKKDVEGAHTPSSKIAFKKNTSNENQLKVGGAKQGHKGHGREVFAKDEADASINVELPKTCTDCLTELEYKDSINRSVLEAKPIKVKKVIYRCKRGVCPSCLKLYTAKPGVLPKSLYGNSVLAQVATLHFMHGIPLGKVRALMGPEIGEGGIMNALHRLGKICESAIPRLVEEYRNSAVKHADETGWRTDGESGYAWIFCNEETTIFEFKNTRSAKVPQSILGKEKLPGVLVVDRYGGYNQMPCDLQYCYAHLLREVEKLEDEFNDEVRVTRFTAELSTFLAQAMKLRNRNLSIEEYKVEAKLIKASIEALIDAENTHLGVQRIQQIFKKKKHRLYHWVKSSKIPAENNRAERELRPTVIARKVSFGSQSKKGASTRASLMSVLWTVKKRLKDKSVEDWLLDSLNQMVKNPNLTIADLLPSPTGN